MRRFSVKSSLAVSGSAATNTFPLTFVSGSGRGFQVYEVSSGLNAAVLDAQVLIEIFGTSGTITAGSGITPANIDTGNSAPASVTTCSTGATGFVASPTVPFGTWAFNTRATFRWAAVDPDSRICFPAGGGAAGSCCITNQQPGTVASITLDNQAYFAE